MPTELHTAARHVVLLVYDGFNLLDLSGPLQTFATANRVAPGGTDRPPYRLTVASVAGGSVACSADLPVGTEAVASLADAPIDTLVVVGGCRGETFDHPVELEHWIARHAARARRVCSVCTGVFALANAGALQGRRVTTHWAWADRLRTEFPTLDVDAGPLFIRDGPVATSAGVTAGIDLSLALIEEDLGHATAMAVASYIVVYLKRAGGQSQFSEPLKAQRGAARFESLHAWMTAHLTEPLTLDDMAAHAGMSLRTFSRTYRREVGRTPARMLESLRLEAACRELAAGSSSLKHVAAQCGFGDGQALRRALKRRLGAVPSEITELTPWLQRLHALDRPQD